MRWARATVTGMFGALRPEPAYAAVRRQRSASDSCCAA
jgi:hypothetical protein